MTLNKDGTPRKQGSGRKKGSTSFTQISLRELNAIFKEDALITVSKAFINSIGATGIKRVALTVNNAPVETEQQIKVAAPEVEAEIEEVAEAEENTEPKIQVVYEKW